MDEAARPQNLSLIPYSSLDSREIVLRHGSAVVVYDETSKQLSLRDTTSSDSLELTDCPYCHRPLRGVSPEPIRNDQSSNHSGETGYVHPIYFHMLHHSHEGSQSSSRPPSPRWPLIQTTPPEVGSESRSSTRGNKDAHQPMHQTPSQRISSSAFSQNYFKTFFVEERELGRGGKGVVLLVRHVLDGVSLGQFACKRVPVGDDHEWLEKCLLEVKMLQTLCHPNLVSYRHAWLEDFQISKFGPTVPTAFILQQFCNAGDLHNYITSSARSSMTKEQLKDRIRTRSKGHLEQPTELLSPRRMQLEEIAAFFMDITSGVHYLHSNGFVHRDLKPSNCLLHRTGQKLRVLVSDFGEMQDADVVRRSTGNTGTISYCAPEALRRAPDGQFNNFTQKSDVFSLGMIGMVVNHAKTFHVETTDESTYSLFHVVLPFTIQKRRQLE